MPVTHDTLTFERRFAAPLQRLWAAFADAEARAIWTPPSPDFAMICETAEFRPGGRDLWRCGPGPAEGMTVETLYHEIREERRIILTEVIGMPETPDAVSLVTLEFGGDAGASALNVTVQIASPGGAEMLGEVEGGWSQSLDNLGAYLA